MFKAMYSPKINMNESTHKEKSPAGNIRVKYMVTTQKGQSRKKSN